MTDDETVGERCYTTSAHSLHEPSFRAYTRVVLGINGVRLCTDCARRPYADLKISHNSARE